MLGTKVFFFLFLVLEGCTSFDLFLAFPFAFCMMVPTIDFYWISLSKKNPNEFGVNPSLYNIN
jgi:hypothetical protein